MDIELEYNKALDYVYSFIDYSREKTDRLAKAQFKLDRMYALLEAFGRPQDAYPSLHVAGTKGKGSTSALAAAALSAAGHRTGLYVSPHLQDFAERIQVDGEPIPHLDLALLMEEMKPVIARIPQLTTFEITTALGYLYFARRKVEAAVIEVGLGGRLDATNVITPRVAVITSLSYDHMAVLGNTLAQIAEQKAGIIKAGVPVISSPQVEEARLVLERIAAERGCPLTLVGRDLSVGRGEHTLDWQDLTIQDPRPSTGGPKSVILRIPLLGSHQVVNSATAYAALQASGLEVPEEALRRGFAGVNWPCRFEIAQREPPVIFDSAHNVDSFAHLADTLEEYFPGRRALLVMGVSEDKNLAGMLGEMRHKVRLLLAVRADHPRALAPETLAAAAAEAGIAAEPADSMQAALERALHLAGEGDEVILSAGSMFATAEFKTAWQEHKRTAPA